MYDEDLLVWAIVVLEDAAEQPGSLVLYERNSGGTYEPMPDGGATLYYEGDETDYWDPSEMDSCLVAYNRLDPDESGRIDWFRVRFNYTFPDGSSGYVDSDEFAVCQGTYLGFDGSSSGVSGFSGVFAIDKEILPDPSKLTVVSATIDINGTTRQLETSLDIEEGVLLAGAEYASILDSDETITSMGPIKVTLNYNDGDVDWTVTAEGEIDRTPGVDIWQALVGSTLNGPGGLRSALIDYSINDNGSAVKSSSVTLKQGEHTKTWTDTEGNLDVTINDSIALDDDYLFYPSVGMEIEVAVTYVLDGAEQTKTETYTDIQQCDCYLETKITSMQNIDGDMELINGTITLKSLNGDPCSYTATLEEAASILWLPAEPAATPTLISGYRFTLDKTTLSVGESASFEAIDWPPSTSDGSFEMTVDAEATGTMGGVAYEYVGGLQARIALDASAVNVFGDGSFSYSPDTYLGGSIELLNGVNSDQLTDLSFTILKDGAETTEFSAVGHIIPAAGAAADWVGFEFVSSSGDTVPTLDASAEYEVFATATYDGNSVGSDIFPIDVPPPTGDYLGAGTVSMIEISLSEGFTAKFPLDLSIVPDASDDTISAVSVTLTRPDGATQDLLGNPDSEYYVYSEGANTLFEFRYECPADPLPTGNYTLNVTLTYTSGTVTNLQSSNSASFTVAESPPDYDYWVIDPETWCDPPATGATTVVAKTELIVEYDPEYSYSATVTGGRIIWTVDGTQQSSVAISPLPAMTDNPDQERLESGLVGFTVALPTTGTDWSYKLEFDLDVAASDGSDTTHFSVTVGSSEFSVPLPPQHSFTPSVSVNSADAGTTLELTANGRVVIEYNTETGFTYSAELTALEISLDDGATFQTVDGTYWGYSAASGDVGTLSYDFWIGSGYTLPVEASSARLRFTAHITGEHGSDSYDTTVYPAGTTSITINP